MKNEKTRKGIAGMPPGKPSRKNFFLLVFILIVSLIVFSPAFKNGFNNWDDAPYITDNPRLELTFENVKKSFLHGEHHGMYVPLTALSHSVVHYFSGDHPVLYHAVNVVIHLINISLVFWLMQLLFARWTMTVIITALFAIHTVQVESVAYAAGRRDILFSVFYLLSMIFYIKYTRSRKTGFYLISFLVFLLSLLSKGQAVMLPFALLAFDFLSGRKWTERRIILEKIPFFFFSLLLGLLVIHAANTSAWGPGIHLPKDAIQHQLLFAFYGLLVYITKLLAPLNLSLIYPYPTETGTTDFHYWLTPLFGIAIAALLWILWKRRKDFFLRQVLFGILFFLINIILVLQVIPNSYSFVNEHYMYLPSIGFFIIMGLLYEWARERSAILVKVFRVTLAVYFLILSVCSFQRCMVFKDSITVWTDVLKKYPDSYIALYNRGNAWKDNKQFREALNDYNGAIRVKPAWAWAYTNRGGIKVFLGDFKGAIEDFDRSIQLEPDDSTAYFDRGNAKSYAGDFTGAIADYTKSISLTKNDFDGFNWRGKAKFYSQHFKEAIVDFDSAIALRPDSVSAWFNRGSAKANLPDIKGALADFQKAIELNPRHHDAYLNRGIVYAQLGIINLACSDFEKASLLGNMRAEKERIKYCVKNN